MSGVEVVGAVLGGIPLLISALEHFHNGVSTIRYMKNYETVFENFHTSFVTSLSIYRNSCEELLRPLVADNELYELFEGHGAKLWEDPKLGERVRERLGPNYEPYKNAVNQLRKKIDLFGKKLKLDKDKDMNPPWIMENGTVDASRRVEFFKNFLTRVKGGFQSEKYAKLLADIVGDINQIATLTKGAIALEPLRLEQRRRSNSAHWIRIRDHARRLFETFHSHWSCTCSCQHPHRASLRLDMRKDLDKETRFGFKLSFDLGSAETASLPWYWRDVEIEPLSTPGSTATPAASGQPLAQEPVEVLTNPRITLSSPSPSRLPSSQISDSAAARIADLCKVLRQKTQPKCCLGFLDNQAWQDHVYSVTLPSLHKDATKSATLAEIVHQGNNTILNIRERCSLALTLAFAVLQLHDTPWLSENWKMEDILFINNNKIVTSSLGQPYVSKIFVPTTSSHDSTISRFSFCRKNEIVFTLGIALLELSYGRPILSHKSDKDRSAEDLDGQVNGTYFTEISIANRLTQEIGKRELPNYANAVIRCVNCSFGTLTFSLNDDGFRESFYQGVVLPLQRDYEYVTSTEAQLRSVS
ncbi:hypothetical protein MMC22_004865 [Lobaria immixta]|nr:hypothetical protein [Lobaria immixta]